MNKTSRAVGDFLRGRPTSTVDQVRNTQLTGLAKACGAKDPEQVARLIKDDAASDLEVVCACDELAVSFPQLFGDPAPTTVYSASDLIRLATGRPIRQK